MKKEIIIGIIISSCLCFLAWHIGYKEGLKDCKREFVAEEVEQVEEYDEWTTMMRALMQVESGENPDSISPKGAAGVLQLMPCYVEDANRILGALGVENAFSLDDRFDVHQSIAMFTVVQRHYNPEKDIDKAIRLHNPKAGDWYYYKVKSAMYDIARRLYNFKEK